MSVDLRRLLRVLTSHWWQILLVGLLGVAGGIGVARSYNSTIEPSYRADAPIVLLPLGEESEAAFEARLGSALARAQGIVAPRLLADPRLAVETNPEQRSLDFTAEAADPELARSLAADLRAAYLDTEPSAGLVEQYQTVLADLEARILELREQQAALVPEPPAPANPDVTARIDLLSSQLSTLRQQAASISLQLAYPELAETEVDTEALSTELATVEDLIERIAADLARLGPPEPATTVTTEQSVDLSALVIEQRLRNFESQYVETSLRLLEITDTEDAGEAVLVADVARSERSETQAGALGLVAGLILGTGTAVASDRIRRPIRGPDDPLPVPVLGPVHRARPGARSGGPWYPRASGTTRRRNIQALRASLDSHTSEPPVTVGLAGLGAADDEIQAVAADLAASVAASGRPVLLVDANLESPSILPEFGADHPDLADLLGFGDGPEDLRSQLKQALTDRPEVLPDLTALRAGAGVPDPVDALAGRQFRELVSAAGGVAEVIVVAAPAWGDPATAVLAHRLDLMVLVSRLGKLTLPMVESAVEGLREPAVRPVGLALLVGRPERRPLLRGFRAGSGRRRRSRRRTDRVEASRLSEDGGEVGAAQIAPAEVGPVSRRVSSEAKSRAGSDSAGEVVAGPPSGVEPSTVSAAEHLEALVLRILQDGRGSMLIVVGPQGTLATDHLLELLTEEADGRAPELDRALGKMLGCVPGRDDDKASWAALDLWLYRAFLTDRRASDRPVAQLASPHGVFRALVHVPSFDRRQVSQLRGGLNDWLRVLRAELAEQIRSADERRVAEADRRTSDIEELDRRLAALERVAPSGPISLELLRQAGVLAEARGAG